jgi:hypothetical protein
MLQCNIIMAVQQIDLTKVEYSVKSDGSKKCNIFTVDWGAGLFLVCSHRWADDGQFHTLGLFEQLRAQRGNLCGLRFISPGRASYCGSFQPWQIGCTNDLDCDKG